MGRDVVVVDVAHVRQCHVAGDQVGENDALQADARRLIPAQARRVFEEFGPPAQRSGARLLTAMGYDFVPGALAGALALRPGTAGDRFAIGAATLSLLSRFAEDLEITTRLLRRERLTFDGLTIDATTREVVRDGQTLRLTAKEFDLLWFLARHPKQVFSRDQLMDRVWGYSAALDTGTVTVHVRRLREKLEADPAHPAFLQTVWGVGYRFSPP